MSRGFDSHTGHVTTDEIILPKEDPEPTLLERLNSAMYAVCTYGSPVRVVRGHEVAYLVSEEIYEEWLLGRETQHG